jgi:hypothetical protein
MNSPSSRSQWRALYAASCAGTCHRRSSSAGQTNSSPGSSGPEAGSACYPYQLGRIRFHDPETGKTLVILTNYIALPAPAIGALSGIEQCRAENGHPDLIPSAACLLKSFIFNVKRRKSFGTPSA